MMPVPKVKLKLNDYEWQQLFQICDQQRFQFNSACGWKTLMEGKQYEVFGFDPEWVALAEYAAELDKHIYKWFQRRIVDRLKEYPVSIPLSIALTIRRDREVLQVENSLLFKIDQAIVNLPPTA
jgi:hypothetical protein